MSESQPMSPGAAQISGEAQHRAWVRVGGGAGRRAGGWVFCWRRCSRAVARNGAAWGRSDAFKKGETVEVKFEDASPVPWAGVTGQTAAWLRHATDGAVHRFFDQLHASRMSRCGGCRKPIYSCAPAMAASTTGTARWRPDRRPVH